MSNSSITANFKAVQFDGDALMRAVGFTSQQAAPLGQPFDVSWTAVDVAGMSPHVREVFLGSGGNARQRRLRRRARKRHQLAVSIEGATVAIAAPVGRDAFEVNIMGWDELPPTPIRHWESPAERLLRARAQRITPTTQPLPPTKTQS